jgi:CTP:molybdopterin cytidylyltransferase MocA
VKIAVLSCLWERYELAPAWWQGMTRIRDHWREAGHECDIVVAGSEDTHRTMAADHAAVWVEAYNDPLGAKFNAAAQRAFHDGADYLMVMGSDDFLATKTLQVMANRIQQGARYVGLSGCWFHDLATGRTSLFEAYPVGHAQRGQPIGLGRLLHRSLLPRHGRPWQDDLNRSLDWSMTQRCKLPKASVVQVGETVVALDVKTRANIWSFDRVTQNRAVTVDHPALQLVPEWPMLRALRLPLAA